MQWREGISRVFILLTVLKITIKFLSGIIKKAKNYLGNIAGLIEEIDSVNLK